MRVLDLDLDFFLDAPIHGVKYSSDIRVTETRCVDSVWSETRVRNFLERNLKLSKTKRVEGRVLKGHDEALFFWNELIEKRKLVTPFSVIHVDSHADLSYGDITKLFILNDSIFWAHEKRIPRYCKNCEFEDRFYNIGIGNYLLYAIAFGWVSELTYCANPNDDAGDVPQEILCKPLPNYMSKPYHTHIRLRPTEVCSRINIPQEPVIPLHIIPQIEYVQNDKRFDFISIAQSPNYTPANADFILEIVKEYICEI